uniref:Uncharacterized protein n=1 Tax=Candidozyma auris TaxID=498019 RepID=A0A0L0P2Z9_CANAR
MQFDLKLLQTFNLVFYIDHFSQKTKTWPKIPTATFQYYIVVCKEIGCCRDVLNGIWDVSIVRHLALNAL